MTNPFGRSCSDAKKLKEQREKKLQKAKEITDEINKRYSELYKKLGLQSNLGDPGL